MKLKGGGDCKTSGVIYAATCTKHDIIYVGHTGTLDPMATGVMVLTLGHATRLGRFLEATEKVYDGRVRLVLDDMIMFL